MWKKDDATPAVPEPTDIPPRRSREPGPSAQPARSVPPGQAPAPKPAAIGPSITIRGEVSGDEDLLIRGTVEGSVDLGQHAVEVGREGRVKANITGRIVTVEGAVEGDLRAEEQIVLRPSADVKGDITAPRIVLEDGARFRGMVEMGEPARRGKDARKEASAQDAGGDAGTGKTSPTSLVGGSGGSSGKESAGPRQSSDKSSTASEKSSGASEKATAGSDKAKAAPEKVGGQAR